MPWILPLRPLQKPLKNWINTNPITPLAPGCLELLLIIVLTLFAKKKLNTQSIHGMMDEDGDEKPLQIRADVLNPEETSIKKQQTEELKLLIQSLPTRYRNLITLRYFDELSYEEIAQQLDLPLGTVKAQLFRARYLLGNILNRFNRDDI